MSGICNILFPNSEARIKRQIDLIDNTMDNIRTEIQEKRDQSESVAEYIKALEDPDVKFKGDSMSRKRKISSEKNKLGRILAHIVDLESKLEFFERSKYSLENNEMTKKLSDHISQLTDIMKSVRTFNSDKLVDDTEKIHEVTDTIDDSVTQARTTMNAWDTEVYVNEDDVNRFLDERRGESSVVSASKPEIMSRKTSVDEEYIGTDLMSDVERKKEKVPQHSF